MHDFLFCLCAVINGSGVGIVDGYILPIPKISYQVFLRYRLVKYRENTDRYRTEIPNRDATLFFTTFANGFLFISVFFRFCTKKKCEA